MIAKTLRNNLEVAVLGGGCFWCLDAVFSRVKGIESVVSGYAGGQKENPTYKEVCTGTTGHAEVVKVDYNPKIISYREILNIFFVVHDPTTLNRQVNDIGPQYRSIILYDTPEQKAQAEYIINQMEEEKIYPKKFVTELKPLKKFYPAEEYHQKYFEKNSNKAYCQIVISPKLAKLRKKFNKYYK